ncbi:hypothetical protein [Paracidovorax citrulli]
MNFAARRMIFAENSDMKKLSGFLHLSRTRRTSANEEATSSGSRQNATSSASPSHALAGASPRHRSADVGVRPRTSALPAHPPSPSHPSILGMMRGWVAGGSSSKTPDPGAWLEGNVPYAKAARVSLFENAVTLPRSPDIALPVQQGAHPFRMHGVTDTSGRNTVLAPAQELIPGLLRPDQFIDLSSRHLDRINALATTHPSIKTQMPDTKPHLRVITPTVAAHLAAAREAIDLVKALLPYGAGNQVKDIAATGGESVLRSSLSYALAGSPQARAFAAIQSQGGYCDAQAALTYQLLSQNPALRDCRIDMADGKDHVFVVIRGQKPAHDIVVDPWAPFASPTLVQDALPMHRTVLRAGQLQHTKTAGTILPPLDIGEALRRQNIQRNQYSSIKERFRAEKNRDADSAITSNLKYTGDQWDAPFSGNPNVRYDVRDDSGRRLIDGPLRFDMQRTALSTGPYQPSGA